MQTKLSNSEMYFHQKLMIHRRWLVHFCTERVKKKVNSTEQNVNRESHHKFTFIRFDLLMNWRSIQVVRECLLVATPCNQANNKIAKIMTLIIWHRRPPLSLCRFICDQLCFRCLKSCKKNRKSRRHHDHRDRCDLATSSAANFVATHKNRYESYMREFDDF